MTPAEAADILKRHNEWRRGGDGPMTDPETLGAVIDVSIAYLDTVADIVDIARGLSIERDPERGVYVGVTGDHKDAKLLDEAFRKLDGIG